MAGKDTPYTINVTPGDSERKSEVKEQITSLSTPIAWEDPQEQRNPHNWSLPKRLFHTAVPCLLSFQITFGTSITVPATKSISAYFNISPTTAILVVSVYTLGLAFGPLFFAPLSEILGRKRLYMSTIFCLLVFTTGAALAQSFPTLLICRFFASFLGSAPVAIGAGTVMDVWGAGRNSGIAGTIFILGPFLGPCLAPLAGAYILENRHGDWRWTQWLVVFVGIPPWLATLVMQETSKARILQNAEKTSRSQSEKSISRVKTIVSFAILRAVKMLFTEAIVYCLTIYTAYAYGMIFSFFGSSSYVLTTTYGFDLRQVGLSLTSVIIGFLLAGAMFIIFDRTLYARAAHSSPDGIAAPEHRLYSSLVGSCFLTIGLFWYAWAARPGGNWALLVASGIPFGFGSFSLFLSAITYTVDVFGPRGAASALAANGTLRYSLGAIFPLFTVQAYQKLGIHWAGTIFAVLSVVLLPIPWMLFRYGPYLRAKSRFETSLVGAPQLNTDRHVAA